MGGRNGTTSNKGKQTMSYLEKYQVEDVVNGIKVTRTKFRLKKGRGKGKK